VSVTLSDGTAIARNATTYTLATNDFVNAGGDGYTVLADGTGTSRAVMADVLLAYIQEKGTISPLLDGRIDDLAT
jgi:5'-nucleotidase